MIQIFRDIIAIIRFEYRWRKWKKELNVTFNLIKEELFEHKELIKPIREIMKELSAQLKVNRKASSNLW